MGRPLTYERAQLTPSTLTNNSYDAINMLQINMQFNMMKLPELHLNSVLKPVHCQFLKYNFFLCDACNLCYKFVIGNKISKGLEAVATILHPDNKV